MVQAEVEVEHRYRWVVLAVGSAAQASTAFMLLGIVALTPSFRAYYGLDLAGVGALIGTVSLGCIVTMIAWGSATDRFGECAVMVASLLGCAGALVGAAFVSGPIAAGAMLFLTGALAAGVNAASGRAVLTWFPLRQRGMAMAVRQTAAPAGAAIAAVLLPATGSVPAAFVTTAIVCVVSSVAVAIWIREPPAAGHVVRAKADLSVVLGDRRLLRLSTAGLLLVIPSFLGMTFLVEVLHRAGLSLGVAGALLAASQIVGGAFRIVTGVWSDKVSSRLAPLRIVALVIGIGYTASAFALAGPAGLVAAVLVPTAAIAISWNGLVHTAAGEMAPPGRAATAIAVTNTGNFVAGAVVPMIGGFIGEIFGLPAMLGFSALGAVASLLMLHGLREGATRPGDAEPIAPV